MTRGALAALLVGLGKDPERVLQRIDGDAPAMMERNAEEARRLGLFGSPHFIVGTKLSWGDDRLEDAIVCATRWSGRAEP
jgi:2-hydroxychromene-2-carboxylate isomerase